MIVPFLAVLATLAAVFLWLMASHARDHAKTHGMHRITYRALTGRRTDGKRYTNASFWRQSNGVVSGHPVGRVSARHHRAGVANLLRTLAWITVIILSIWGVSQNLDLTLAGDSAIALGLIGWKTYLLIKSLRRWYTGRTVVTPLADALGPILQLTGPETENLIKIEPDYLTKKTGVIGRIDVPTRFNANGEEISAIRHLISTRLPVPADLTPRMTGKTPHLLIHAAPELPNMVRFASYISEIEKLGPGKYLAGIDRSGGPYIAAFDGEDPHHGMAYGTGRGKSTAIKNIVSQIFHNELGATATVIDPKEISLDALAGVPGIAFYNNPAEFEGSRIQGITIDNYEDYMPGMWRGIKSVYELMNRRYEEIRRNPTAEFPTHLLILEECNSFAVMSKTWWAKNKPKGIQAATPPVWADYVAPIFWRGRQANIKVLLVAQSIQERFLGSINLRPSLGMISLSGFKASQWQNYVGTSPVPRAQRGRGRAIYVAGESETWVQNLLADDNTFREFAMNGRTVLHVPTVQETMHVNDIKINSYSER